MKTLIELFETSVKSFPDNPLLWEKLTAKYEPTTYKEVQQAVYEFGAGLMALGLKKGERAGLLSEGRNYWLISELSILYCGAINVPLSVRLEPSELKFRIEHSGLKMMIVSAGQASKLSEIIDQLPSLENVILLDGNANPGTKEISLKDVIAKGVALLANAQSKIEFEQVWQNIQPDDVANISYTSGTTADPKGIMLTHNNYAVNVKQAHTVLEIYPDFITLATLPWDHSFAHTACL